jgi:aminotransferase EvaB
MTPRPHGVTGTVPFNDLSRSAAALWSRASPIWEAALRKGWVVLGDGVTEFEQSFADYLGGGSCIGVASGTDALELALRACGVRRGSIVALAANAGFYSSTAIIAIGATPRYIDVAAGQVTPGVDEVRSCLRDGRVDAVVITHLFGLVGPEVQEIADLCASNGVRLVEDCAQSHGARRGSTMGGAFSDAAAFSFYPTKNLGALGDGGAVFTRDDDIAARVRSLRQYGWSTKYHVGIEGGRNSRLDELQAIVLSQSLTTLDERNARRRRIIRRYQAAAPTAVFLGVDDEVTETWVGHLCVVAVADRAEVRNALQERGVATDVHFPVPDHRQEVWRDRVAEELPRTEQLAASVLSLPCFPEMTDAEIEQVAHAVSEVLS